MFKAQADEIVRRCEAGFPVDIAVAGSGPQGKLASINDTQVDRARRAAGQVKSSESIRGHSLNAAGIKSMKHDIGVLKQMKDIREASVADDKPFQYSIHANAERRQARRDLRRLAATESEADRVATQAIKNAEEKEMEDLMKKQCNDESTPSLLPVLTFLIEQYVNRLPLEKCQSCAKNVLPQNPKAPALIQAKHTRRPMRVFCGHWLHHCCLDQWLTTPPFVRACPACTRRIYHADWPDDVKQLEKAWAKKQETEREKNDLASMMGF
jgi:hypothetical protein